MVSKSNSEVSITAKVWSRKVKIFIMYRPIWEQLIYFDFSKDNFAMWF
jgi:hypothetical protein